VLSGQQLLTQFLRLRLAAEMSGGEKGADTNAMRAELKAGRSLEIAGYELPGEVATALDAASLTATAFARVKRIGWFEVSGSATAKLSPPAQRLLDACQGAGVAVESGIVSGLPFWTTPEIAVAPALIEVSTAFVTASEPARVARSGS
jgi:hypothetical protein